MIAVLALVPAVSAYSTPATPEEIVSQWPRTIGNLSINDFQGYFYADSPTITVNAVKDNLGILYARTYCNALYGSSLPLNRSIVFNEGGASLFSTNSNGSSVWKYSTSWDQGTAITNNVYGIRVFCFYGSSNSPYPDSANCEHISKWWIGNNQPSPINYGDLNLTVKVKSLTSGIDIPRADVEVWLTPDGDSRGYGKTDLNGDATFALIPSTSATSLKNVTVSKVGYNSSSTIVDLTENTEITIHLQDAAWDTSGTKAVVYLDIVDETTNAAISGATIGIKNTTNEINPWYYNTYPGSTIAFSTDGTNDLAVGQTVEFAGYKSGFYSAGHTDPISILAPVSHASLSLSKSDMIDPLDIANGSYYWYPVTVVDSTTGNAISDSALNYQVTDDLYWVNKTSATGKFNMTGKGPMGVIRFENGDTIMIEGYADGYIRGGYALGVDSDNSGVTQFVSLVPSSYQAVSGEWTAVLLAYDDDSTAALSGVSIQLKNATSRFSKSTTSSGSATFTNLISGESYTMTASKSGYTTMTKTITGWSAGIVSIDVPLSKTSVNPSITTTITPLPGETSAPASDDNIAGWMRTRAIDLMDWFYFFIILGSLGILLKMFNLI